MMKYIDLINRHWRLDKTHRFTGNQTRLYFYLLSVANEQGWPDSFDQSDAQTEGNSGISRNTMKGCRDRLIEVGLIGFSEGGHGKGNRGTYEIRYQNLTPTIKPVRGQKLTPTDADSRCQNRYQNLTPKNGAKGSVKVSTKVSDFDTYTYIYRNETIDILSLLKKGVSFSFGFGPKKQVLPQAEKAPPVAAAPPAPEPSPARQDPFFLRRDSEACNVPFTDWQTAYGVLMGESTCRRLWSQLSDSERLKAMEHTTAYVKATPNKRFRKSPINYLDEKTFNDDIIDRNGTPKDTKSQSDNAGHGKSGGQREIIRTQYVQQKFPRSGRSKPAESGNADAA